MKPVVIVNGKFMRDGVEVEPSEPSMTFTVKYKHSKLDREAQFGITSSLSEHHRIYERWVWFYLGAYFGENKPAIYPYSIDNHTKIKVYKYCNDAKRQAKLIFNHINKLKSK